MSDEKKPLENKPGNEIKVEIDEQTSNGVYSNLAMISHTDNEFILDFIFIQPQYAKAKVRSRIIASPVQAKRLLRALQENVARYEAQFGEIKDNLALAEQTKPKYYN